MTTTNIIKYLRSRPFTSFVQLVCFLVYLLPTAVLASIGFGTAGPIAGFLAPSFQSTFGTPMAFSFLQSAAMGGASATKVLGVIKSSAVLTALFAQLAGKTKVGGK